MYIKQATVNNQVGLHARPATFFIQKANEFKSTIWVEKDEQRVNAKSLLGPGGTHQLRFRRLSLERKGFAPAKLVERSAAIRGAFFTPKADGGGKHDL